MQLSLLKIITGKKNLSSRHSNFAPIKLGKCYCYFIVCSPLYELVVFKKHSVSAYILNGTGTCFS